MNVNSKTTISEGGELVSANRQTAIKESRMKITTPKVIRWAGLSAMAAGIIFAGIQPIHPPDVLASVNTSLWAVITSLKTAMSIFGLFAIAGLWEHWRGTEGAEIESCTLLTTEANELVRPIHDRMPVILDRRDYEAWLDSEVNTPARVASLLRPSRAAELVAVPVGLWVNDPRHDDPRGGKQGAP